MALQKSMNGFMGAGCCLFFLTVYQRTPDIAISEVKECLQ